MSSTEGSEIITGWKRRSSAASFSMYLRYSSIVVAPMVCNSPRASAGLSMLPASIDPSPPDPAPTMVCNSSMNRMSSSECSRTSSSTLVSRSSNSPRYFAPATIELMSSAITRRPASVDGTSPLTMRCARPSTIAVFPTPGSPISTGLFLRRRERISMVSSISSLRPTTGSTLPSLACSVRSRPYSSSVGVSDCAAGLASALRPSSIPAPPFNTRAAGMSDGNIAMPRSTCSGPTYPTFARAACCCALRSACRAAGLRPGFSSLVPRRRPTRSPASVRQRFPGRGRSAR